MKHSVFLFFLCFLNSIVTHAQIKMPSFFSDNMIMQQKAKVSIWGKDIPNTVIKITSSWGNQSSTTSDSNGFWKTTIKTKAASFLPQTVTISGSNTKTLKNILIGEVWFCSGQSNMEMPLEGLRKSKVLNAENYFRIANNKHIRLFNNARTASVFPAFDVNGTWKVSNLETAQKFSAIGYIFGVKLYKTLNIPIGIIESAWGGTKIESWIPKADLLKYEDIKFLNDLPKKQNQQKKPTFLYNAMIHPFQDFKVKGILWYQGESNRNKPEQYYGYMEDLIHSWRQQWNTKRLPFHFVQIAPFDYTKHKKSSGIQANIIREAQHRISQNIKNTAMVVTTDAGDCDDIHPSKKEIVALRLANSALAEQYGVKSFNYRSAELKKIVINNAQVLLEFNFDKNDFFIDNNHVKGFAVASSDRKFYPAKVTFTNDKKSIILHSKKVKDPVAVRYGFSNCFESNLKTNSGLPISVFRTDNW